MEFEQQKNLEPFRGRSRLPQFAVPKRYDLTIKLDLSANCSFSGQVLVGVSIKEPTKFIVLNSLELDVHQASFTTSQNHKYVSSDIIVGSDDEIVVLVFEEDVGVGDGVLAIDFSGILNEHLVGLYRCTYLDNGEKKNMAATQFEAVDARRCFPCWDEPAFKATFKITLENVPSELTALSNMPISEEKSYGHHKTVRFEESVVMSTYLVAVVVGLFEYIEDTTHNGIKIRAYCPVGESEKGRFALDIAAKALKFFETYFSMPYPLPKLDMVAVPEFSGGAMENYGLIIFRDIELLKDDLHSAAANIQRLTIVVAHEVAHHWFGNLVTMEWWTHLWLNEGFATWVSYLVTDILFPEWKIWNKFLQEINGGLHLDALVQSHPIEEEIPFARSVLEYFDAISYEKGSSVIRMLQNYLGDDVFQKSLASYMRRYAFKNAKTDDLWSVLSETSGVEVNRIMDLWTKQKGYPVISVNLNGSILQLEQTHFSYSVSAGDAQWIIPVTLSLGSYNKQKKFLLEAKLGKLGIEELFSFGDETSGQNDNTDVKENWWIKINTDQIGFYRVNYDENLAVQLRKALASNSLSAADEFGILDDMYALCEACLKPFSSLLHLMNAYRKDVEYVVLSRLIDACYGAARIIGDAIPEFASDLKSFFNRLLLPSAEKMGWDSMMDESQLNSLMREEVMTALVSFGHPRTNEEAIKRFHEYSDNSNTSPLPVDTRKASYVAVMRNTSSANRSGLEKLIKFYKEVDAVQEKTRILRCMASCPDPTIVKDVLNFMISDEVRHQDVVYILAGISWEGRASAWTWFKENFDLILKKCGRDMLLSRFIRNIISPLSSHEMANEVEEFFAKHPVPSIMQILKQSLEHVRIKAKWIEHIKQEKELLGKLIKELASKWLGWVMGFATTECDYSNKGNLTAIECYFRHSSLRDCPTWAR